MLEKKGKLAPAGSQTQDNLHSNIGFQQPKLEQFALSLPYRLVLNDGMVQLTFAGVPIRRERVNCSSLVGWLGLLKPHIRV